jgi:3-hydroxybutyryl-CoA dehydrogenase
VTGPPIPTNEQRALPIIGIVGAGAMGAGIAQVALEAGSEVVLQDVDPAAIDGARAGIRRGLERRAAHLDLDPDTIDAWAAGRLERLREASTLDAVTAEAELIIEAALEDLGLKQEIFRALDAGAPSDTILATNTSALSIDAIAGSADQPARVLGLHFFNPVPRMPLVEVVPGELTAREVIARAEEIVTSWGKIPVRCTDSPGFIVNRVNRPFTIEALRILESGAAAVEGIDDAMRGAGFPLGPFELMDLTGIDVTLAAARGVWEGLGRPEHLRPSEIQERLAAAEHLGRKSGLGFYVYTDGRRGNVAPEFRPQGTATTQGAGDPAASGMPAAEIRSRILGAIDAEARRCLADGVAAESDIDLALRLGAGHPMGPFERMAATD